MNHFISSSLRRVSAAALVIGLTHAAGAQPPAAPGASRTAAIHHGALVVRDDHAAFHPLVAGGAGRALPVWSADGLRIAFIQAADRRHALADLVVVSSTGRELTRVAIEPVLADTAYAGMRAVEGLQWVDADRVAVRGSINPSQSQYYVIDLASGKVVDDFVDDNSSAAFAPDGRHLAYQTGSPHFTAADRRAAQLVVDGQAVYPPAGERLEFATAPAWSADGRSLAVVAQDHAHTRSTLVVWHEGGALHEQPVALGSADQLALYWAGSQVILTAKRAGAASAQAWAADAEGLALTALARAPADPQAEARSLRDRLQQGARASGVTEPDVWCSGCALQSLPRASE